MDRIFKSRQSLYRADRIFNSRRSLYKADRIFNGRQSLYTQSGSLTADRAFTRVQDH